MIVVIPPTGDNFGREFDSRHLHHYGGARFRRGWARKAATGKATDLIGAKKVNANDSIYEMKVAA